MGQGAKTIRSVDELRSHELIKDKDMPALQRVADTFSIGITPVMIEAMQAFDSADPLYRQFVPAQDELDIAQDELAYPTGDDMFTPVKGVVHRHADRVLLMPVTVCPVYCRFCFRREKVSDGRNGLSREEMHSALDYIRNNTQIWEVILTGGDPLMLSARRLAEVLAALDEIDHVKTIRIHSRVPVAEPSRVTTEMITALQGTRKPLWLSIHCNHVNELSADAKTVISDLSKAGVLLVSQTVLLKGVNDKVEVLENLFRTLLILKVKPYYLHYPDMAQGTSHFRLSKERAKKIMAGLRARVAGLALPMLVIDNPDGDAKQLL